MKILKKLTTVYEIIVYNFIKLHRILINIQN